MDEKELGFILHEGEGLKVEFKEGFDSKTLAKEMVAFANSEGGRIFIGINDKGEINGIEITNKLKSEILSVARNCDPHINIELEILDKMSKCLITAPFMVWNTLSIQKSSTNQTTLFKVWWCIDFLILIVNVIEGLNKPYRCATGFFLRQGSNSQKLSTEEIRDFFNKEGKILFDDSINNNFSFKNGFSKLKFDDFIKRAGLSRTISDEAILKNLGVLTETGKFRNAGVLFFCDNVERFFRHVIITCVLYKGTDKTFIIDRKDFHSDIYSNYNDTMNFMRKNLKLIYRIEGFGPRKEILEIPDDALKEVVLNAIAHRDYNEKGANIQVDIFDDRVEISNPRGLIIKESEFGKISRTRNPLIFNLLQRLDLIEKVGSGIGRIRDAMAKN